VTRSPPARRADFRRFEAITTRWKDNDAFGHVNNVVYYSFFDTAVARFLLETGGMPRGPDGVLPVVAETLCRYHREIAFPDRVTVGLRVARIGQSSVRYEIGVFREDEDEAAAEGHFVHVYVDRAAMRPVPIPEDARQALARLLAA